MHRILVVDDENTVRYAFRRMFEGEYSIREAGNGEEALLAIEADCPDVILMDICMPIMDGLSALKIIKQRFPNIQVLLMTAYTDTSTAMEAMKEGAFDYIIKPFDNTEIRQTLQKACHLVDLMGKVKEVGGDAESAHDEDRIVGCSRAIIEVSKLVGQLAQSDLPALVVGETGVGKELVARAIFQHSARAAGPFMVVNCASLPDTLIESELFGYESGAFTGAVKQRIGRFEQCKEGTLFLDEVGELPIQVQAKVLRFLQDGRFERLGGNRTFYSNVRIIAATNCDLEGMVSNGSFRRDLFHRLNVFPIAIPPLRERPDDIPLLAKYFVERYGSKVDPPVDSITPKALAKLVQYPWPGNIRELQNVIRRSIVLSRSSMVTADDCQTEMSVSNDGQETRTIDSLIEDSLQSGGSAPFQQVISKVECALITKAMLLSQENQVQAAKLLGISRLTLRKKLELCSRQCSKY